MKLDRDFEFLLHALQHTCASRLVNKGIDLYVVKEWLGIPVFKQLEDMLTLPHISWLMLQRC